MLTYFVLVLQFVLLSLWIGGTTLLLMVVAPSTMSKTDEETGSEVMGQILRKYGSALTLFLAVLVVTFYFQLVFLSEVIGLKIRLALTLTSLATLIAAYGRFTLQARIDAFRSRWHAGEWQDEENLRWLRRHQARQYLLLTMNLFLGLSVVIILILPF